MLNGYILIKEMPLKETKTENGIIIPKLNYQRLCEVCSTYNGSKFNIGDVIIKPIGKSTPIIIDGETYECIKETLIFAKMDKL